MTQSDTSAEEFHLITSADLAVPAATADGSEEFAVSQQMSAFLDENAAFWSKQLEPGQPAGDGVILTDLMVRQVPYYFGNITVSKYLQLIGGGRLVGLLPVAGPACYRLMRIAESYGFEGFMPSPVAANQYGVTRNWSNCCSHLLKRRPGNYAVCCSRFRSTEFESDI